MTIIDSLAINLFLIFATSSFVHQADRGNYNQGAQSTLRGTQIDSSTTQISRKKQQLEWKQIRKNRRCQLRVLSWRMKPIQFTEQTEIPVTSTAPE